MLTLPFVVSPSGVEWQNTRTSAMKKKEADKMTGGGIRDVEEEGVVSPEVEKKK